MCNLAVCKTHFAIHSSKGFYSSPFDSYDGKNICYKCLEPLKCIKCGSRATLECVECKKYFCSTHCKTIKTRYSELVVSDGETMVSSYHSREGEKRLCLDCEQKENRKKEIENEFNKKTSDLQQEFDQIERKRKEASDKRVHYRKQLGWEFEFGMQLVFMPLVCLAISAIIDYFAGIPFYLSWLMLYGCWIYIMEIQPRMKIKTFDKEIKIYLDKENRIKEAMNKIKKRMQN
jgi:hypothetical protein